MISILTPVQLTQLVQIELRCVREYALLFEDSVPEPACDFLYQHSAAAHRLSEILWEDYQTPIHGHRPSQLSLRTEVCRADREND